MNRSTINRLRKIAGFLDDPSQPVGPVPAGVGTDTSLTTKSFEKPIRKILRTSDSTKTRSQQQTPYYVGARDPAEVEEEAMLSSSDYLPAHTLTYPVAEYFTPQRAYKHEYILTDPYRFGDLPSQSDVVDAEYVSAMQARAAAWGVPYNEDTFYPVHLGNGDSLPEGYENPNTYGTFVHRHTDPNSVADRYMSAFSLGYRIPADSTRYSNDVSRVLQSNPTPYSTLLTNANLVNTGFLGRLLYGPKFYTGGKGSMPYNVIHISSPDRLSSKHRLPPQSIGKILYHELAHAATPGQYKGKRSSVPGFKNEYESSDAELLGQMHSIKALYGRIYRRPAPKSFRQTVNQLIADGILNSSYAAPKTYTDSRLVNSVRVVGDRHPAKSPVLLNRKIRLSDGIIDPVRDGQYINLAQFLDYILNKPQSEETDDRLDYLWQQSNNGRINKRISDTA